MTATPVGSMYGPCRRCKSRWAVHGELCRFCAEAERLRANPKRAA